MNFNDIEERIAVQAKQFAGETERSNDEVIDELEVAGGKTNQINFCFDVSIAVWFACQGPFDMDGRIIMVKKNAVRHRFVSRKHAPRQAPVLVSDPSGRIPEEAIVAVERVPAELKGELKSVIARTDGVWQETVFSGRIQSVMGCVRLQGQQDTSDITWKEEERIRDEHRLEQGLVEAAQYFGKKNRVGDGTGRASHAGESSERTSKSERRAKITITPGQGVTATELVGLRGQLWMDTGIMYYVRVRDGADGHAGTIAAEGAETRGLVHLRMTGWRTAEAAVITVGETIEVELAPWPNNSEGTGRRTVIFSSA